MLWGQFGMVEGGQFNGEIIYRDTSGWHSLTKMRYWPALGYVPRGKSVYVPDMEVRLLNDSDCLTVEDK
jgi:hypothetical protein